MSKPTMQKVMGKGRGTPTLAPIVEDEMPQQKKKKHESCERDFTPSADTYDDYTYSSSSEEEEKMESNSDLSHEEEAARLRHGMFGWT
jgi:hypothetical protein